MTFILSRFSLLAALPTIAFSLLGCTPSLLPYEHIDFVQVPQNSTRQLRGDGRIAARVAPFHDTRNNSKRLLPSGELPAVIQAQGTLGMVAREAFEKLLVEEGGEIEFLEVPAVNGDIAAWNVSLQSHWLWVTMVGTSSVELIVSSTEGIPVYRGIYSGTLETWSFWPSRQKVRKLLSDSLRESLVQAVEDDQFMDAIRTSR